MGKLKQEIHKIKLIIEQKRTSFDKYQIEFSNQHS